MTQASSYIVFPHQLYQGVPYLKNSGMASKATVYIVEEPRYFTDFKFHKMKLAYHRASMKHYYDELCSEIGRNRVKYVEFKEVSDSFYEKLQKPVAYVCPVDHKLEDKLEKILGKATKNFVEQVKNVELKGKAMKVVSSSTDKKRARVNDDEDVEAPAGKKAKVEKKSNHIMLDNLTFLVSFTEVQKLKPQIFKNNRYMHDEFYKYQRKKLDILMKNGAAPEGGKWSFDEMNRQPLPNGIKIPKAVPNNCNSKTRKYIDEAKTYVHKNFEKNYGYMDNLQVFPMTHSDAITWLDKFLEERLGEFGPYEDAMTDRANEPFLFHSVLTPMMNIGILKDEEVVQRADAYYKANKSRIPLHSYEGFIRQVIGWRNYVYTIYQLDGRKQAEANFFKFGKKINNVAWWEGKTGIPPIDSIIKQRILPFAYMHHIERLMYLGNTLLICGYKPTEVHRIFMEWSIDSYDWVMVPNVYGMSQFSDGGMMMSRPYFCSSNYMDKMSSFKRSPKKAIVQEKENGNENSKGLAGNPWFQVFDAVYYKFIADHKEYLKKNYATSRQVLHWEKKSSADQKKIISVANNFLETV